MNPRFLAIFLFLAFATVMLFVAHVALWWVGLVVLGLFVLYALA